MNIPTTAKLLIPTWRLRSHPTQNKSFGRCSSQTISCFSA